MENIVAPFVETHCSGCHSGDEAEAGLALERLLEAPSAAHRRREWQRVLTRLERGEMPPPEMDQPEPEERQAIVAWLKAALADPDCSQPQDPGRVTLRRLNRIEYQNTIRDLLGVEFNAVAVFPRDELGFGFDNNGDVLSLPPVLLEKYLQAAEDIAAQAIVTPEAVEGPRQRFEWGELHGGSAAADGARGQFTNGRVWAEAPIDVPGEYVLRAEVFATQAGDEPTRIKLFAGDRDLGVVPVTAEGDDPQTLVSRFTADAGNLAVGVELTNDHWDPAAEDPQRRDRNLFVRSLTIVGPIESFKTENLPEGRRRVLSWTPSLEEWKSGDQWIEPSRELIGRLLIRAYRRPPTGEEIDRLIAFAGASRERGDSFERAMQLVLEATLASPQFLFRGEPSDSNVSEQGVHELNEFALASRLSYFLWSSMPDEPLLRLAADGKLRRELDGQIDRMLASPQADQLVRNFGEQWLETRRLDGMQRDAELFPDYDESLGEAFRQETYLLLKDIVQNDRPLTTLLSADYSFLNARLAKHYGLGETEGEGPDGDAFVRMELPTERRSGLLAHGSVLAVTSHDDRTAPVLRGKWVLDHLLADPPAPPPPGVGVLPEATGEFAEKSLRERLEIHRADPSCAVCHNRMDPLGLAMENFDAVGRWREHDGADKIDASGQLPDGRRLDGPGGLRDVLLEDFPKVRRCIAEKLLTYALGRGLEPYDQCAVNEVVAAAESQGDTFASMVRAIVKSDPFQKRNGED